jgi:xanthine dehydrogenase YagT iron-sulfur-binding subunit
MLEEFRAGVPSAVTLDVTQLDANPAGRPGPAEIRERMSGNLCRCGAYNGIVEAIEHYAAGCPEGVSA